MSRPVPTACAFCMKPEYSYALYNWVNYVPACADCAVENMGGDYKEIVDALAVWPVPKKNRENHGL